MEKDKVGPYDLVIIGGSAGSLQVVLKVVDTGAPEGTPILLVLHREPQGSSRLTELLSLRTHRKTKEIEDKDPIERGWLYICPADYHVLVEGDRFFSLDYSEKEHFSRPSIDVAFRAAADVYGDRLLCILLSGANADGATGLKYAKERGATTVIQDPRDASVSYMPEQALLIQDVNYVLDTEGIHEMLRRIQ